MRLELNNTEVHIWNVDIQKHVHDLELYHKLLSSAETEQAGRFHFEKDKIRYTITHAVFRLLISSYSGIEPVDVEYSYNKHKKPCLQEKAKFKNLTFNLSHSGMLIVFAFALNRELGIDIEKIKPMNDADGLIERFCSEREKSDYFSIPAEMRNKAFFRCWSRKEAYIKARGTGLYFSLAKFSVSIKPEDPPMLLEVKDEPDETERWRLYDLDISKDYSSSLMVENGEVMLRFFEWNNQIF